MRICFTGQVDPARLDAYREAHAAVWPEMLEALREAGWRDYRLYLGADGLLVGTVETDSYGSAQARMAATAVNARWQAAMAGFFDTGSRPDGSPDEQMTVLEEIFDLDRQLAALGLPTAANPTRPPAPNLNPTPYPTDQGEPQ
ncbi:MAG: L-rhamnose mutarotase [Bifidobacteriaceae bacterium]|jgi:L-rhamnose mutarotase|nr:L-rhamnose mutarotase [Bifidobacteriaceae bacterium]